MEATTEFRAKCARIMKKELATTTTVTMLFPGGARAGSLAHRGGEDGAAPEGSSPPTVPGGAHLAPGKKKGDPPAPAKGKGKGKGKAAGAGSGAGSGAGLEGVSGSGSGPGSLDEGDAAVEAGDLDAAVQPLAPTGTLCGKVFIGMATAQTTGGECVCGCPRRVWSVPSSPPPLHTPPALPLAGMVA